MTAETVAVNFTYDNCNSYCFVGSIFYESATNTRYMDNESPKPNDCHPTWCKPCSMEYQSLCKTGLLSNVSRPKSTNGQISAISIAGDR